MSNKILSLKDKESYRELKQINKHLLLERLAFYNEQISQDLTRDQRNVAISNAFCKIKHISIEKINLSENRANS